MITIPAERLRTINTALFVKAGADEPTARRVSEMIVENCLYGHDSHGMALVPRFIDDLETGKIQPRAEPKVDMQGGGAAVVDGKRGFGQLTMNHATQTAVDIARAQGVSAVTVTNCNHVGMLWNYARMAAEQGAIAMIWCVSGPDGGGGLVAPHGGKKKAIGANPMGIGVPAGRMRPLVLDISTSTVAGGKVKLYAQQSKLIPLGWILDAQGQPTTDPNKLFKDGGIRQIEGALLPMAGHKGFGLALVAEILGGILTRYGTANLENYREGNGGFVVAVDVGKFVELDEFGDMVDAFLQHIKSIETDDQTEQILIPGELEFQTYEKRQHAGVPVTDDVWEQMIEAGKKLGVDVGWVGCAHPTM